MTNSFLILNNKKYPSKTAGGLMITSIPIVTPDYTIKQIEELLLSEIKRLETINYIYITLKNNKLVGVISIKDILRWPKNTVVSKIINQDLIITHPYTDQEKVAYLALKKNIKAVPVVDREGKLLGVVPNDKILEVIYKEASEDLLSLAGVTEFEDKEQKIDNVLNLPINKLLKHRLPWLFIGLLGGILTAQIIGMFERTIAENLILASFIPLIVYMGGATLAQTQAFYIRDIAINPKISFLKYFIKQSVITFFIAFFIALILFICGNLIFHDWEIITVLSTALFAAIFSSLFTGLFVPFFFSRLNLDPANASGPIATVIQDLLGVSLYFSIAYLIL